MNTPERDRPNNEDVLRLIDELAAEAEHTDEQSREALEDAGIDPEQFALAVRRQVQPALIPGGWARVSWDAGTKSRAGGRCRRRGGVRRPLPGEPARRCRGTAPGRHGPSSISPLLPVLASEDPQQRSLALAVAQQVDPAFATETSQQLARWEVSTQAQARREPQCGVREPNPCRSAEARAEPRPGRPQGGDLERFAAGAARGPQEP